MLDIKTDKFKVLVWLKINWLHVNMHYIFNENNFLKQIENLWEE